MRKYRYQDESSVDMTPMLDIVFIMLIFFIVTTSFTKEDAVDIERPANNSTIVIDPEFAVTSVKIHADDSITFEGLVVEANSLPARLGAYMASKPNARVIIQSHEEASVSHLVQVVDAVRQTTKTPPVLASLP